MGHPWQHKRGGRSSHGGHAAMGDKEEQPPLSDGLLVEPCAAPPYLDCSTGDGSSGATMSSDADRPAWAVADSTSTGEDGDEEEFIGWSWVAGVGAQGRVW
jgi:hypothetical protein